MSKLRGPYRVDPLGHKKSQQALDKMAENARELGLDYEPAQQEPVLQEIEQYRLQMAGISTAAIGYWKEGDGIHSAYDTVALRDVAKLYAKYDELYRAQPAQKEPVAIKYWLQDTMESGRWVTTDNMAKATAEKMLSGEYGDVYPQGRIVEPSPPAQRTWVGLTDEERHACTQSPFTAENYRAIEAKLKEKNT